MRTLFVDHTAALGGAELYLFDVARHTPNAHVVLFEDGPLRRKLESAGVPVTVLAASSSLLTVRRNAGMGSVLRALPSLFGLVLRLARLARSSDVVFLNSQKALIVGSLAARLARRPAVWNLHDILTADHFSTLNRRLAVFCANTFVDHVIVNSEATRTAFLESGGRTSTGVVYNGIDPTPYDAVTTDQVTALRRELGIDDAPIVGVFSRLASWKGQHVLLDALSGLSSVHALLVGDALFGEDEAYAQSLRRQCDSLNLMDRVHFLGFRDDIPSLMHLVDVLVHTSIAPEPFGRVIVEGMLAETPVVATAAGGALEIVTHEQDGLLVPPDDPEALRNALDRLFSNPTEAHQLAQNGRTMAESRFSQTEMLSTLTEHISAVI